MRTVSSVKNICHEKKLFSTFGPLFKNHICPLHTSIGAGSGSTIPLRFRFSPDFSYRNFILSLSLQQIYHKYSLLFRIKSPPEITQGRKTKKKFHKHFSFFRIFSRISRKKKEKIPLQRFINLYSTPINPIPVSLLIRSRYRNFLFLLFSRRHIAVPPTLSQ